MSIDRNQLRARVRALLEKTEANGCTEAEAMAATAKAAELMRDYALSEAELLVTEAVTKRESSSWTVRSKLWSMIAHVTNCAALLNQNDSGSIIHFYGIEPGPQIAAYLRDICNRAIDTEIAAFKMTDTYRKRRKTATRRQAVKDFTDGMVIRLCQRVYRQFSDLISDHKRALAEIARDSAHPDAVNTKGRAPHKARFDDANRAGQRAGERVGLHRGVNGTGEVHRIGSGS